MFGIPWLSAGYLFDWLVVAILLSVGAGMHHTAPAQQYVSVKDREYSSPYMDEDVTALLLGLTMPTLVVLVLGFAQLHVKKWHEFHDGALAFGMAVGTTFFFTELLQTTVGKPTPDFLARCKAKDNEDPIVCLGDKDLVRDGYRSFPSEFASISFCTVAFVAMYLAAKTKLFRPSHPDDLAGGRLWKAVLVLFPFILAILISTTRVTGNRSDGWDVLAGAVLGVAGAYIGYRWYFPSLILKKGSDSTTEGASLLLHDTSGR